MGFKPGQSGNPNGRPKRPDHIPKDIRDICTRLFDAAYWRSIKRRLRNGELNPRLEVTLLAYAFGAADKLDQAQSGVTVNLGFLGTTPHTVLLETPARQTLPAVTLELPDHAHAEPPAQHS